MRICCTMNSFEVLGSSLYIDRNGRPRGVQHPSQDMLLWRASRRSTHRRCGSVHLPRYSEGSRPDDAVHKLCLSQKLRIHFVGGFGQVQHRELQHHAHSKCGFATDYLHCHSLLSSASLCYWECQPQSARSKHHPRHRRGVRNQANELWR